MTERNGASAVLRKKLGGVQSRGYHYPIQRELASALEYAAAKGVGEVLKTGADAIVAKSRVGRVEMLTASLPSPGLIVSLEFEGGTALFALDCALAGHVVDIRTGGDPDQARQMADRMPTAIDSALCRPLIGAVMDEFERGIHSLTAGAGLSGGYAYGRVHHLPAALQFALTDQPYLVFQVTLDLGEASRGGSFHLALPLSVVEPVEAVLRRQGIAPVQGDSQDWARHMRKVVAGTRVSLTAVLDRGRIPVAELARLEAGGLFPLPGRTLDDISLDMVVEGVPRRIARGRLGALGRNKAVKLAEPPETNLLAPLIAALEGAASADTDIAQVPPGPERPGGAADGGAITRPADTVKTTDKTTDPRAPRP